MPEFPWSWLDKSLLRPAGGVPPPPPPLLPPPRLPGETRARARSDASAGRGGLAQRMHLKPSFSHWIHVCVLCSMSLRTGDLLAATLCCTAAKLGRCPSALCSPRSTSFEDAELVPAEAAPSTRHRATSPPPVNANGTMSLGRRPQPAAPLSAAEAEAASASPPPSAGEASPRRNSQASGKPPENIDSNSADNASRSCSGATSSRDLPMMLSVFAVLRKTSCADASTWLMLQLATLTKSSPCPMRVSNSTSQQRPAS
mmetsp:Transcript_60205/g.173692  ORF Transcript_60205/g.173692 Transcript_60205/m.173692 type:complete len:257 (-) Transcript_60205:1002-1772(-)